MERLISEKQFEKEMEERVEPLLAANVNKGTLAVNKSVDIHYEWYQRARAKGNVVILHGYTESAEKFREMMYYFYEAGYQVFAPDHRGHGYSTREVMPNDLTHIDKMDDYVEDLHVFMEKVVKRNGKKLPVYLYAHSMGGAIGILYQMAYPNSFSKLVLSSPMFVPLTGQVPLAAAKAIAWSVRKRGNGKRPVAGASRYQAPERYKPYGKGSEARWEYYAKKREKDEHYQNYCPTYSWIYAACCVKKCVLKQKNVNKISEPVLLFQAEHDAYVRLEEQNQFVSKLKKGKLTVMEGTSHEIYMSNNDAMNQYLDDILAFLNEQQ